jgi:hypothetical protein
MKASKWIVLAGAGIGIISTFMPWITVESGGAGALGEALLEELPTSGMDNGGPVFIFLLALALVAGIVGAIKRFGRGMGGLALAGGLLSTFMALVKYADIHDAASQLSGLGNATIGTAIGWYLLFFGSLAATMGGIAALIKPEPKLALQPA